jgi:hypothetical protein
MDRKTVSLLKQIEPPGKTQSVKPKKPAPRSN